jgi:type I restriction enzyme R subunit
MADVMFPGKYQSDFAVQVTSQVPDAQQFAINFANNNLLGSANFLPSYRTSKARVCVTVGMMTTGYDCTDILNLGLFRPIFSPTDFVQIKGRGTRRHNFLDELFDSGIADGVTESEKTAFKLFDFFANCVYFETEFDYDESLQLPRLQPGQIKNGVDDEPKPAIYGYEHLGADILSTMTVQTIGYEGMRIDRMLYDRFADTVRSDEVVKRAVEAGNWDLVIDYVNREVFDKPKDYYTLEKLRKAAAVDRRLTLREILEKVFDLIPVFKSKDDLLEEEFRKFVTDNKPDDSGSVLAIKMFFKAYVASGPTRNMIDSRMFTDLATNAVFSIEDYRAVPEKYRKLVPEYVKDYVSLNQFTV